MFQKNKFHGMFDPEFAALINVCLASSEAKDMTHSLLRSCIRRDGELRGRFVSSVS